MTSIEDRFWSKVDTSGDCWVWTGRLDKWGYGSIWNNRKQILAHRYSAMLHFGMFDRRLQVNHTCDNPSCVRPEHLYLGSQLQNVADRESRNRHPHTLKTHCKRGHEFTEENTGGKTANGKPSRYCKQCHHDYYWSKKT